VTLDVDLINDGNFTDPGETGYATGYFSSNSTATIKLPTLPGIGTYTLRADVTDLAGNVGTRSSTLATFQVIDSTPWVITGVALQPDPSGDVVNLLGDVQRYQALNLTSGGRMGFG
jgi:hypothetical protein